MTILVVDLPSIFCPQWFAHGKHGGHSASDRTVATVRSLAEDWGDDGVAVCCDCPNTLTWRHEIFPRYKADRDLWESRMVDEYERAKGLLAKLCPVFAVQGFEGEDLCATVCAQLWAEPVQFVVASTDKDVLQMVCSRVRVWNPSSKVRAMFDSGAVLAKHGVAPGQIRDWLCLMGDTSDGIPGIKGIGTKTAAELLKEHRTIQEVLRAAIRDTSGDRIMKAICNGVADAEIARKIVCLRKDAPIDCSKALRRRVA